MWPFGKTTARRKGVRRSRAEREGAWWNRISIPLGLWGATATFFTAVLATLILQAGGAQLGLREGQFISRAMTARVPLRIENESQTAALRIRARESSPNYYRLDVSLLDDIRGRLSQALVVARAHLDDRGGLRAAAEQKKIILDDAGLTEVLRLASLADATEFDRFVEAAIRVLRVKPLVDPQSRTPGVNIAASRSVLLDPAAPQERAEQLVFTTDADAVGRIADETAAVFPEPLRASMAATIKRILAVSGAEADAPGFQPLYRFDTQRTLAIAAKARDGVETQYDLYRVDAVLASGTLSAEEIALLKVERDSFRASPVTGPTAWGEFGGRTLLVFVVVFGAAAYVSRYHRQVFQSHLRWTATAAALLAVLAATRAMYTGGAPPHVAVGSQALAAALLGVVYSHGAVFAVCAAVGLLMTLSVEQGVSFLLVLMAVSGTLVFGLAEVRNRGKIVSVGVLAAVVALLTSMAAELIVGQGLRYSFEVSIWAALATLLAAFVMEGILPAIERVFGLATGMTLLEWCDANKKLLRMMAAEAPGTFNHSMLVANLAEAAAEAIGANGLLARAGAYYHDIGKINKPEYFVENQVAGISRHDRLSPAMSLLIIVGHVKDGIEMAREYGLPKPLRPFIAEHHGTTLVEYFYHAATKQRKLDDPAVAETAFRYPGPKPQSRETAIVMLCDGVEGAVRAMTEPTPNRIEGVVSDIVRRRLVDDQLGECDLTFRELSEIETTLVSRLCSIYHARIAYPEREEAAS
jgi:hypothetical protein